MRLRASARTEARETFARMGEASSPLVSGLTTGRTRTYWMGAPVEQELPIIQIRNCLLVSIQTELHDRLALDLQASLMDRVRTVNARGVILDVSAVEIIDSYITRILNDIGKSVRFMGAECYIVGIRPAVAMTLIEMGVELDSVNTALNLDLALERLELLQ